MVIWDGGVVMIHVCYSLYDKTGHFSKIMGTSILSLLENTSAPLTIHLICFGEINEQAKDRFHALVETYGHRICIYNAIKFNIKAKSLMYKEWLDVYSPACINRLFIWDILPDEVQRIICLDADTIIHMDINDLWQQDVGINGLAAVVDNPVVNWPGKETILARDRNFDVKRYINAGVVIMDRKMYCRPDWMDEVNDFFALYKNAWYGDQDVLNYYYGQECKLLPERYNMLVGWLRFHEIKKIDACIYHYSGDGYNFNFADAYTRLFFSYFVRTPWYDMNFLHRLWSVIPVVHDERTKLLRNYYQLLEGKNKIIVGAEENRTKICQIMHMTNRDKYVVFKPGQRRQNIDIAKLASNSSNNIILLFDGSYADFSDELVKYGCQDEVDFVNGDKYLTWEEGCPPLNEHEIFMQL